MTRPPRPEVGWRQLCALTRDLLLADAAIDDFEWKERIKWRLAKLGFAAVSPPHQLTAAMSAVEAGLARQGRRRPPPVGHSRNVHGHHAVSTTAHHDPPGRRSPGAWMSLQDLAVRYEPHDAAR